MARIESHIIKHGDQKGNAARRSDGEIDQMLTHFAIIAHRAYVSGVQMPTQRNFSELSPDTKNNWKEAVRAVLEHLPEDGIAHWELPDNDHGLETVQAISAAQKPVAKSEAPTYNASAPEIGVLRAENSRLVQENAELRQEVQECKTRYQDVSTDYKSITIGRCLDILQRHGFEMRDNESIVAPLVRAMVSLKQNREILQELRGVPETDRDVTFSGTSVGPVEDQSLEVMVQEIRTDRDKEYDHYYRAHRSVGLSWAGKLSQRLRLDIPPLDPDLVALMMADVKLVRLSGLGGRGKKDSYLDAHGYLSIAEDCVRDEQDGPTEAGG